MKNYAKTETVKKYCLPIVVKKEGDFYVANCQDWSDCYAQGSSIDEATSEIISVASALIELYEEEGLKIPLRKLQEQVIGQPYKISFNIPVYSA